MKATNINWDIDAYDVMDYVCSTYTAEELFGLPTETLSRMANKELLDMAYDKLKKDRWRVFRHMHLPTGGIVLPESIVRRKEATDWLWNEYGYDVLSITLI